MATTDATYPSGDELDVCTWLRWHAHNAAEDGEDLVADGDYHEAALRLLEASELYRTAAHQLDRETSPTVR